VAEDDKDAAPGESQPERWALLAELEDWLEVPMQVLGFIWLGLLVLDLTRGLNGLLATLSTLIWVIFIADFAIRFTIAPEKRRFLRGNWLAAISLLVPALRILRVLRFARLARIAAGARGFRLVRVVGSLNRGMNALRRSMGRRGLAYVIILTVLVIFGGAAGMYAFESGVAGGGIHDYPSALWWTAMVMTTLGSEYWPRTVEGRTLCLILSVYAFTVFGYITASLASYFVDRDADSPDADVAGNRSIEALRSEIAALREQLRPLTEGAGRGTA
jgi:voltage-gated potassium channel